MIIQSVSGHNFRIEDPWDQDFEIPLPFLRSWGNSRMHWRQQSALKRQQKYLVGLHLGALGIQRPLPLTVLLRRVSRGTLDDDNVPDAMKYVRDEVARWLGLPNDNQRGLKFLYGQERTKRKGYLAVRVTIWRALSNG